MINKTLQQLVSDFYVYKNNKIQPEFFLTVFMKFEWKLENFQNFESF